MVISIKEQGLLLQLGQVIVNIKKIASEMPVPHSLRKYFSTPWDIEVVKQYKVQDTFRAVSVILRSK